MCVQDWMHTWKVCVYVQGVCCRDERRVPVVYFYGCAMQCNWQVGQAWFDPIAGALAFVV